MFEISGKYGSAKVYTNTVEESAMAQIVELCNSPYFVLEKVEG